MSVIKSSQIFIYLAQNHKSQSTWRGFTICPGYDTHCPLTLDSSKNSLKKRWRNLR